jgi:hypothetical protein
LEIGVTESFKKKLIVIGNGMAGARTVERSSRAAALTSSRQRSLARRRTATTTASHAAAATVRTRWIRLVSVDQRKNATKNHRPSGTRGANVASLELTTGRVTSRSTSLVFRCPSESRLLKRVRPRGAHSRKFAKKISRQFAKGSFSGRIFCGLSSLRCMSSEPFGQVSNRFKRGSGPSELKLWLRVHDAAGVVARWFSA